jgi:hypothetical protein
MEDDGWGRAQASRLKKSLLQVRPITVYRTEESVRLPKTLDMHPAIASRIVTPRREGDGG